MQQLAVGSHLFPFVTGYLAHTPKTLLLLLTFLLLVPELLCFIVISAKPHSSTILYLLCYLLGDTCRVMVVLVSSTPAPPARAGLPEDDG